MGRVLPPPHLYVNRRELTPDTAGFACRGQRFGGGSAGALRPLRQQGIDFGRIGHQLGINAAWLGKDALEHIIECLLGIAIPHAALLEALLERGNFLGRGEVAVEGKDGVALCLFGIFGALAVGDNFHHQLAARRAVHEQGNVVVVAFAHLAAIKTGQYGAAVALFQLHGWQREDRRFKRVVEIASHIAREFDVLHLILAHRHDGRLHRHDICRHQDGIGVKPHVNVGIDIAPCLAVFIDAGLIGMATVHQALGRDGGQQLRDLKNLRHIRLAVKNGLGRIKPEREIAGGDFVGVPANGGGVMYGIERMIIGDEDIGVIVFRRQFERGADGADIVADMRRTRGFDTGKNNRVFGGRCGHGGSVFRNGSGNAMCIADHPVPEQPMCGKFKQGFDLSYLAALLKLPPSSHTPVLQATPGKSALALLSENADLTLQPMRWGFASAPGLGVRPVINARAETLASKPMFAAAYKSARCALPVSSYLEGDIEVGITGVPLFYLGGLWQRGADGLAEFSVITREPTDDLKSVYERMPLVLADRMTLLSWINDATHPRDFPAFTSAKAQTPPADTRQMALF